MLSLPPKMPLQPPVPFADFEFTFDPSLSNLFPNPPPLPSSADLFSPAETDDLLGFLDNFGDFAWDVTNDLVPQATNRTASTRGIPQDEQRKNQLDARGSSQPRSTTSESSTTTNADQPSRSANPRNKPLLSTPQKRLNHIMSEQKRRNAIRDGYAQLIALMAPAGSAPGIDMPTRGRPKGSGSRGKGQTKGKSGVLFRAVEYCRWLEEGRSALQQEVLRVEAAAGIRPPSS
ncbi:hypothetical protein CPB84DRAFT_1760706 [Gymnopilus junonius]|uniref:BHLH domain-containing protein n=1 Tax=Gymnopilus junonius TaxID=109634 RepID=A0A9P5TTI9_GYMJU|nr:hypothetical protein CPB84DRAFT_1760706 [Gymnopilus junonius]